MGEPGDSGGPGPESRNFVVVPHRPGPLISLDTTRSQRGRDDLDELIDDLFPDVEERAGLFDAALVAVGAGLLAWGWIGTAPTIVTVLGVVALALGCILPIRTAWRRARDRQLHRRREGLLEKGVPIEVLSAGSARLVGAYEDLLAFASRSGSELGDPAIAAAHCALLEVATLLKGRAPASESEVGYVDKRAVAVAELVGVLQEPPPARTAPSGDDVTALPADALIEAREELDQIAPFSSVNRLDELIAEARIQRRGGG